MLVDPNQSAPAGGDHCPTCGQPLVGSLHHIFEHGEPNTLGELLRGLAFTGDGYGCYTTFDVRDDAREWSKQERYRFWRFAGFDQREGDWDEADDCARMGRGYTWKLGSLIIDAVWFWDGDGTLVFCVRDSERIIRTLINNDCKKDYRWENLRVAGDTPSWVTAPTERGTDGHRESGAADDRRSTGS